MNMIIVNADIWTMDDSNPRSEAVVIENGKITFAGSSEDALSMKTGNMDIIDMQGKTLLPGFIDSHMHFLGYGAFMEKVNLAGARSIDEVIESVKIFISQNSIPPGTWVQGRGWNHDHFDVKRFPDRSDLDRISDKHPIFLSRACGHVCSVNSKALEAAGIDRDTPQIEGGHFDIDIYGNPTGILRENAVYLVYDCIPRPDMEDIKNMILNACNDALKQGITSIQTDDFESVPGKNFSNIIRAYKELEDEGALHVRINEQCLLSDMSKLDSFLNSGYRTGQGSLFFSIGPLKLLADGSLGARTALLNSPYDDNPSTCGIPVYTQSELDMLVLKAHSEGMQIAIHCIGDKAMHMAFESYEKALCKSPRSNHRHSIVHCQITDSVLLDKFKILDVVAHVQPIFLDYDLHIVEDRVGVERARTTYNWKGLIERGVHTAFGSDCPVEPFNVLHGIYCAVTRKDLSGYPEGGWLPEQKITVQQAVYCYTMGAAYASFEENIKGSITIGKLADMVVLSDNIFQIPPDDIKDVEVLMTFVDGKIVYKK